MFPPFRSFRCTEQVNLSGKIAAYTGNAPVADVPPGPGGLIGATLALATGVAGAAVGTAGTVFCAPGAAPAMTSDAQKQQILAQLSSQQVGPAYDAAFVKASL